MMMMMMMMIIIMIIIIIIIIRLVSNFREQFNFFGCVGNY